MRPLSIGYSSCPNDTFIFYALKHGLLTGDYPAFAAPVLADVETLNEWAFEGRLAVTKLSFHAFGHVVDKYALLNAGSALGYGCGPLIVAPRQLTGRELAGATIAIPGRYTTAAFLLRSYCPACSRVVPMRFDAIMPAVAAGIVDAGVIIHESRFTYRQHGLEPVLDLGEWWEGETGLPIPLGGIAVRRDLDLETMRAVDRAVAASLRYALAEPEAALPYMRLHAREMDETVLREHVRLYVGPFSEDLGEQGRLAVRQFLKIGRDRSILPPFSDEMITPDLV